MSEKSVQSRESKGSKASKVSKTSKTSKTSSKTKERRDTSEGESRRESKSVVPNVSRNEDVSGEANERGVPLYSKSKTKTSSEDKSERRERSERSRGTPTSTTSSEGRNKKSTKSLEVSPAVKAALADLAADAEAVASISAAQDEMRLMKNAEAEAAAAAAEARFEELERQGAEAKTKTKTKTEKKTETLPEKETIDEDARDPSQLLRELAAAKAHLDASDASRRVNELDLDLAGRREREFERENDELKRRLVMKNEREKVESVNESDANASLAKQALSKYQMPSTQGDSQHLSTNHEELFELKRRISNLVAEVQLGEIDKEKLRQLREDAETRRSEAEAKHANAEVELARSRAAINRLASLEVDLNRVIAAKESSEEKHRAEIRASTSEAESKNAKLTAEVSYFKQQLDKKREKKRLHKAQAFELAAKLKQAVDIAKATASDCENVIAQVQRESDLKVQDAIKEHFDEHEREASIAAAQATSLSNLAEALEKKRVKKQAYKVQVEELLTRQQTERNETNKYKTALVNARKLYESERTTYEATVQKLELEHESIVEKQKLRIQTLEDALKRAAKDYKKMVTEQKPVHESVAILEHDLERTRKENAKLSSQLSFLEVENKRVKFENDRNLSETKELRAKLKEAESDFITRLERDRRAWEQAAASRGEYIEFDPYARGARDGRPKQPPRGGRDENANEAIDDVSIGKTTGTGISIRAAGVSSAHLEKIAMREKNKYAQRQKDLAIRERAEYLS